MRCIAHDSLAQSNPSRRESCDHRCRSFCLSVTLPVVAARSEVKLDSVCHMASFIRSIFTGGGIERRIHVAIQPERSTCEAPDAGGGFAHGQLSHAQDILFRDTDLRVASAKALTDVAPSAYDLHDAPAVRFTNGGTGVPSGSCAVPEGHGFEMDIRIYGRAGSLLLDIDQARHVQKLRGGEREVIDATKRDWTLSCEGPANRLDDMASGSGTSESPGDVGARAVETLDALLASGRETGTHIIVSQSKKEA